MQKVEGGFEKVFFTGSWGAVRASEGEVRESSVEVSECERGRERLLDFRGFELTSGVLRGWVRAN